MVGASKNFAFSESVWNEVCQKTNVRPACQTLIFRGLFFWKNFLVSAFLVSHTETFLGPHETSVM